jgi:tetratricopeptide (TPR) repeat protein
MNPLRLNSPKRKLWIVAAAAAAIAALGFALSEMPPLYHQPRESSPSQASMPAAVPQTATNNRAAEDRSEGEVQKRFNEAVVMIHAGKPEYAIAALHRVLELRPRMPEAHVNMGFALLDLNQYSAARDFFRGAIALNARQSNAYYGLAESHEALGELPEAIGAMRTFLHLAPPDDAHRGKARSALWEWESKRPNSTGISASSGVLAPPEGTGARP